MISVRLRIFTLISQACRLEWWASLWRALLQVVLGPDVTIKYGGSIASDLRHRNGFLVVKKGLNIYLSHILIGPRRFDLVKKPLHLSELSTWGKQNVTRWEYRYALGEIVDNLGLRIQFVNGKEIQNWQKGSGPWDVLNDGGNDGWELVTHVKAPLQWEYVLKRPKD